MKLAPTPTREVMAVKLDRLGQDVIDRELKSVRRGNPVTKFVSPF